MQILLQLKSAGLVSSTRGAAGGYQLAKDPEEISLGEVMGVIDGQQDEMVSSAGVETPISATLLAIWRSMAKQQQQTLRGITIADLIERSQGVDQEMYYI